MRNNVRNYDNRILVCSLLIFVMMLTFGIFGITGILSITDGDYGTPTISTGHYNPFSTGLRSGQGPVAASASSILEASFSLKSWFRCSGKFREGREKQENTTCNVCSNNRIHKEKADRIYRNNRQLLILRFCHTESTGSDTDPS